MIDLPRERKKKTLQEHEFFEKWKKMVIQLLEPLKKMVVSSSIWYLTQQPEHYTLLELSPPPSSPKHKPTSPPAKPPPPKPVFPHFQNCANKNQPPLRSSDFPPLGETPKNSSFPPPEELTVAQSGFKHM